MNALVLYIVIAIAIALMGGLGLMIGAASAKARILKSKGDLQESKEIRKGLIRWGLVSAGIAALGPLAIYAGILNVNLYALTAVGDPINICISIGILSAVAGLVGFVSGERVEYKINGLVVPTRSLPKGAYTALAIGAVLILSVHFGDLGAPAAAVTSNITESMSPVADLLNWVATVLVPIIIVLIFALIPLFLILMGVKFAGGILGDLVEVFAELPKMLRMGKS